MYLQKDLILVELERFYLEKKKSIKVLPKRNYILNFVYKADKSEIFDIQNILQFSSKCFYYSQPEKGYNFLALEELYSIVDVGKGRFEAIDKKIRLIKEDILSNNSFPNIPLFYGGMKIFSEKEESEWKDFQDSQWIIPHAVLINNQNESYFVFNFIFNHSFEKVKAQFERFFNNFFEEKIYSSNNNGAQFTLLSIPAKEKKKWKQNVSEAIEKILDKEIDKIVLSRKVEYNFKDKINFNNIAAKMNEDYPSCTNFIFKINESYFFGTSPETLAHFNKEEVELDSLAGSCPRGINDLEDEKLKEELLRSNKNKNEHDFVLNFIKNALTKYCTNVQIIDQHSIKKLQNIQHLYTKIKAELDTANIMFKLMKDLFPTPAVCGIPKEEAVSLIKRIEDHPRGLYSGIIGWFNFDNEGEFVVAIRSALASKNKLYAYAGCGIVEDSNPDEEFRETELKLDPIISMLKND